jgi:hypothetical protein
MVMRRPNVPPLWCGFVVWVGLAGGGRAADQSEFWTIEQIPTPPGVELEVGALEWIPGGSGRPDRLAVASRRGEIWLASNPEGKPETISWQRFAAGLHEVLGLAWRPGAERGPAAGRLYVTQRGEVSRLIDEDEDGRADRFETVADGWGINGDYHEYAFGSKFDAEGNIWVVLCLTGSSSSQSLFRGWCLRVGEDGTTVPTCSGIRSPGGIGFGCDAAVYYTDNQGLWNGTCSLKHLVPGSFMGHPAGNRWYPQAPELGEPPVEPTSGSRIATEMQRIEQLRPPVVQFPYNLMGKSAAGVVCDTSGGRFGPFSGQVLVTDQSHSIVMRCFLEEVDGIRQGACFRMLEGFQSGSLAEQFSPAGTLYVGGTNRGWGSRGPGSFALERVRWTGKMPFEILAMRVLADGFELEFTQPVDSATIGDLAGYAVRSFAYLYQSGYGSPEVDEEVRVVERAELSSDGRRLRLTLDRLREGCIHEVKVAGLRNTAGEPLRHHTGWYTLNRLPR